MAPAIDAAAVTASSERHGLVGRVERFARGNRAGSWRRRRRRLVDLAVQLRQSARSPASGCDSADRPPDRPARRRSASDLRTTGATSAPRRSAGATRYRNPSSGITSGHDQQKARLAQHAIAAIQPEHVARFGHQRPDLVVAAAVAFQLIRNRLPCPAAKRDELQPAAGDLQVGRIVNRAPGAAASPPPAATESAASCRSPAR